MATHCRLLFHSRPRHPRLYRWCILYPLYVISEIAIIATDLAELLGSAIALCLLFPKLPIWGGLLITVFDVLLILGFRDPLSSRPVRLFEFLIALMVCNRFAFFSALLMPRGKTLAVIVCMVVIITKLNVNWDDAFRGFIPSKYIFQAGGLYTCNDRRICRYSRKLTRTTQRSALLVQLSCHIRCS